MKAIFSLLFLSFFIFTQAQKKGTITKNDLQVAAGNWEGSLVYTDYKDDSTQVSLKTNLVVSLLDTNKLFLKSVYTEPNGKIVNDSSFLFINDSASEVTYAGDVYEMLRIRRTGNQLIIVTSRDGQDNNKEAEIKQTFTISEKRFIIFKEVRYRDKPDDFFTRHKLVVLKK